MNAKQGSMRSSVWFKAISARETQRLNVNLNQVIRLIAKDFVHDLSNECFVRIVVVHPPSHTPKHAPTF